jgi:hypothetical protein
MTEDPANPPELVSIPVAWIGLEDASIVFANQILAQLDDKLDVILSFGQATPPVLTGSDDQQRALLANIPFVQVRPAARLSLSRARVEELISILQQTLDKQDRAMRESTERRSA